MPVRFRSSVTDCLRFRTDTAFKGLIADPAYGGRYVSLTPGHKCEISDTEYKSLVKAHISQHTSNLAFCV